jgi:hypothetical protein
MFSGGSEMTGWLASDLNGDGHDDVVVAYQLSNRADVYYGNGLGGFSAAVALATGRNHGDIAVGDFNEDGFVDLLFSQPDSSRLRVFNGSATGFVDAGSIAQASAPRYIEAIDYNHDGHLDLLVYLGGGGCLRVRLGDGMGAFGAASACLAGMTPDVTTYNFNNAAVFDWDGDGFGDIAVISGSNVNVYRTTGTDTTLVATVPITAAVGANARVLDAVLLRDGDGPALVALGGVPAGPLEAIRPGGAGHVSVCVDVGAPSGSVPHGMQGKASLAGDFDEDGIPDRLWRIQSTGALLLDLPQ